VVLVPPAGGQDDGVGKLVDKPSNGIGALPGFIQKIQAEFQKRLARLSFTPRVVQQCGNVRQAQRDANTRERPGLRHLR